MTENPIEKNLASSHIFNRVVSILEQARSNIVRAVNNQIVTAYWLIGREIVQELQHGEERAKYGEQLLMDLSIKLTERYGKGFSLQNLKRFRQFYKVFANRNPISSSLGSQLQQNSKRSPAGSQFKLEKKLIALGKKSPKTFHPNLSWSHYRALMRVEKSEARDFYETEAVECNWSKRQLERQIHSLFYKRLLMSKDKQGMLEEVRTEKDILRPVDVLKDPYILEFLNLPDVPKLRESDLESAIISNLHQFLLELGKGFSFVARQKRIRFEDEDFYIDLVFYNYILKCFLLIDLKIGKLTHQDIGQMDGYVRMFEEMDKLEGDNPTIGLILCSEKNDAIAKYSVLNESKQLFASKYMLYLPTEEELKKELQRERRLIENRDDQKNNKI